MAIDLAEVLRIARLAHLEFPENPDGERLISDARLAELRDDIDGILEHVRDLESVDVSGVPPTSQGVDIPTRLRADEPGQPIDLDRLFEGAPAADGHTFVVPKVVE